MSRPAFQFLLGAAGPSRWSSSTRLLHTAQYRQPTLTPLTLTSIPFPKCSNTPSLARYASTLPTRPSKPLTPTPTPSVRSQVPYRGPRNPVKPAQQPPQLGFEASTADWPWRPMKSRVKGYEAEERIIFARPYEDPSLGPGIWILPLFTLLGGVFLFFLVFYYTHSQSIRQQSSEQDWPEYISKTVLMFGGPIGIMVGGATLMAMTLRQWSTITRLSQVRVRPVNGEGETKEFIRMVHGLHGLNLGIRPQYMDIPLRDIKIRSLTDLRLRFTIVGKTSDKDYTIPLQESKFTRETNEEVVLSLKRVVLTFGSIRPLSAAEMIKETDKTHRIMDKIFGYSSSANQVKK